MPLVNTQKLPVMPTDELRLSDILIQDLYRQLGRDYPERIFARIMVMDGSNNEGVLMDITWGKLLNDVYKLVASMRESGVNTLPSKTIGVLGSSGYSFYVNVVACWMCGLSVLLLSTRNSVAALESLLTKVGASALLIDNHYSSLRDTLHAQMPGLLILPMQNIRTSYEAEVYKSEEVANENPSPAEMDSVAFYTHTSGSEGHPKPVPITHRHFLAQVKLRTGSPYAGAPVYAPVPLFHGMGFYAFTRWPIGSGLIPTFVPMDRPINGSMMLQHLRIIPKSVSFVPPSLLEDVAERTLTELTPLRDTTRVFFAGAPIKPSAAESLIKAGVPLASTFASSELGIMTVLDFPSEDRLADWPYVRFRDDHYVLHFLEVDDSPLRELLVSPDDSDAPAVLNHRDPLGFTSNDLWSPHPTKPDLWMHVGRKDAVTVLSNGEKTDNKQLERLLLEDERINRVVVFGSGMLLNGVILECKETIPSDKESFLQTLWPTIERTNKVIPQHSRLIPQMVLFADRAKPFISTDKGTIRTKDTLLSYNAEIDAAYLALEAANSGSSNKSVIDVEHFVRNMVQRVTSRCLRDDDDLFDSGIDSLHALQIRLEILQTFRFKDPSLVPRNLVYHYPTISQLIDFTKICRDGPGQPSLNSIDKSTHMLQCLQRFISTPFTLPRYKSTGHHLTKYTIILTGATGSLGCHILREFLLRTDIDSILCFHRGDPETAFQRQAQIFDQHSLPVELLHQKRHKLEFFAVNLSTPSLGLTTNTLDSIRSRVTHIVHAAWELNFNWTLEHFERVHIAGVRHLVDFAMTSLASQSPRFIFLSSIGAVANAPSPVPEQSFGDTIIASNQGYGGAKYIAERIIDEACKFGLHATVIRAGQLSGSTLDGYWTPSEHIPTLLRSSKKLGLIPDALPDTRWIPTDIAAKCVVDLSLCHDELQLTYYHVENATTTPWADIVRMYIEVSGGNIRATSTEAWLNLVEQAQGESRDPSAVALLQFYSDYAAAGHKKSWVQLDTSKSLRNCPDVDFGPITIEVMRKYVKWMANI